MRSLFSSTAVRVLRRAVLAGFVFGMPALASAQGHAPGDAVTLVGNEAPVETAGGSDEPLCAALVAPTEATVTAFDGRVRKNGFLLVWTTAREVMSATFVVEASGDGLLFETLTEVVADGSSAAPGTYCCLDATPAALATARRYYRLRQANADGSMTFSPVIAVNRPVGAQRKS